MKHFLTLISGAMLGLVLAQGGPALAVDTTTSILCTDPAIPVHRAGDCRQGGLSRPGELLRLSDGRSFRLYGLWIDSGASRDGPERGDRTDRDLLRHAREDV